MKGDILKFPKGFLWGTSTSAYQVEGGIENCDWSKVFPAGKACGHYDRYEDDFDLVKTFNQNAFRFSIEWSRIEPEEGKFDEKEIEHYEKVLLALKKRGIIPFVTLYHWTVPLWFESSGGWLNPDSPAYFERYTRKIMERLGGYADFWITINEPLIYSSMSYYKGIWPPKKKSFSKTVKVIRNLARAHRKAYSIIHQFNEEAEVSVAKNNIFFEPYGNKGINRFLIKIPNYFWNKYFLNSIKDSLDFIGLNYYFHVEVKFGWKNPKKWTHEDKNRKLTDMGWEVYPGGIYWALKSLAVFGKPIYILENGLADAKDKLRKDFIKGHLRWVYKAIEEGVNVKGYFHWSLIDNFEWVEGFDPRFGLVEVDYETLERKPRSSASYYAGICRENVLKINS